MIVLMMQLGKMFQTYMAHHQLEFQRIHIFMCIIKYSLFSYKNKGVKYKCNVLYLTIIIMAKYYLVSAACLPYIILHGTYLTLIHMPQHLYKILHEVDKSNESIQNFPLIFIEQKRKKVQKTKIWCEFFQTGFHSCDRWQYSGSLL